jgi:hypothetical protein
MRGANAIAHGRCSRVSLVLLLVHNTTKRSAAFLLVRPINSSCHSRSWNGLSSPDPLLAHMDSPVRTVMTIIPSFPFLLLSSPVCLSAKPRRAGSVVESYQTVSVNCAKCRQRLFRYKKKNGTKSNIIKCFVERIVVDHNRKDDDSDSSFATKILEDVEKLDQVSATTTATFQCPSCGSSFARHAMIRGLPALKLIGGKIQMTKK